MTADISVYELKRKQNMEANQSLLRELGLNGATEIETEFPQVEMSSKRPRTKVYQKTIPKVKTPMRLSRRIRGETPEEFTELSEIVDENDRVRQLEIVEKRKDEEQQIVLSLPDNIDAPVTLRSIGTTIWSLGELNTKKGRSKYWSSRGCKYKHPYPIGYRATKSHFGNDYTMEIKAGPVGEPPIFTVKLNSTTWTGRTPTAPWTEACIKSKSSSTRVSGPLFYGFSDPIAMRMIENMKGYDQAALPEETEDA